MDTRKLASVLFFAGIMLLGVAVLWWGIYYGKITDGALSRAVSCLYSSAGLCGVAAGIGQIADTLPYTPILFWIGAASVAAGVLINVSDKNPVNQFDALVKLVLNGMDSYPGNQFDAFAKVVRNGRDFWAGLMFMGFGLGFTLVAQNYPMGSAVRMGPAYFPTVLGAMLAVLGAMVFFRAFVSKFAHPLRVFTFRPALLAASIVVGVVAYYSHGATVFAGLSLFLFIGAFGPRSMFLILLAVVIFGYALKPLGLVLATVLLIVISAVGGHDFRKKEIVILTIVLVIFGVFVFVKGLGLPFNLWPGE